MNEWPIKSKSYFLLSTLLFLMVVVDLTSCGPAKIIRPTTDDLKKIKTLAIVIPSEENFTVIYDRAKATLSPVLHFGLIGATVATAYNKSLDNEKVKILAPHLTGFSCRSTFLESFTKALNESGLFTEIHVFDKKLESKESVKYDAVVTIRIQDWGLRLIPVSENEQLAGFLELEARMVQMNDNRTLWDEHDTVLGQGRHDFATYQQDSGLLQNDLKEAVETAANSTANKLIYP